MLDYKIRQQDDDQIMKEVLGHGKQFGLYSVKREVVSVSICYVTSNPETLWLPKINFYFSPFCRLMEEFLLIWVGPAGAE